MSGSGLGCVKTPASNLRVEIPSRFRQFENQKCLRPLLGEDDRENNSAHSRLGLVFTQPGSIATEMGRPRYVRYAADSDRRTDIAGGPKGARTGPPCSPKPAADFCQVEFQSRLRSLTSRRPFANINAGCLPTSYQRNLGRFERVALRMGG